MSDEAASGKSTEERVVALESEVRLLRNALVLITATMLALKFFI